MTSRPGGWRQGDPPAHRRFLEVGALVTERGGSLPAVTVAYETWGAPRLRDGLVENAVLVEHALTGDAHVAGAAGPGQATPGWWGEVVRPGGALDTDVWFVVCSNVLGGCQGTTGPSSPGPDGRPWGSRFPMITIRDQVELERRLADHLGIGRFAAVLGGSMGGMRALEWALLAPERVGALLLLAVGAEATADQLGTQSTQVHAITSDPHWHGGDYLAHDAFPAVGLGTARRIAHLTYRAEHELDHRFGRAPQPGGRFEFAIQSYLDHHAAKLVGRFDPGSYVILSEAMNSHDVGRGRGGVDAALSMIDIPTVVAGIDSDRLYPLRLQAELAAAIPTCTGLQVISSPFGHDGFLIETEAVGAAVRQTLARSPDPAPSS